MGFSHDDVAAPVPSFLLATALTLPTHPSPTVSASLRCGNNRFLVLGDDSSDEDDSGYVREGGCPSLKVVNHRHVTLGSLRGLALVWMVVQASSRRLCHDDGVDLLQGC